MAEFEARKAYGAALLRFGRIDEAIAQYERCRSLAIERGAPPEVSAPVLYELGLAHLRRGEVANCLAQHGATSCIFPLDAAARHANPAGASAAADLFRAYLDLAPGDLAGRWLLNLAHMQLGSYPDGVPAPFLIPVRGPRGQDLAAVQTYAADEDLPPFRNRAPELGLDVLGHAGGAALEDFDGDGHLDVLTSSLDPHESIRYFRAVGDGSFVERTVEAGFADQRGSLEIFPADYDGDGLVDVFVPRGAWYGALGRWRRSLLRNLGDGTFRDVAVEVGLATPAYPSQVGVWADYDNDGDLDLFVGNEGSRTDSSLLYPSQLFRNDGPDGFRDVAVTAGVAGTRFVKGAAWGDYDGDGNVDLYVSNYGYANQLFHNRGDGTFEDVAAELGVVEPIASFATWFFDYDNDGDLDLFVAAYHANLREIAAAMLGEDRGDCERPRLYRNDGGRFTEVGRETGLDGCWLAMGANYGDIDNDGWPDIYLGTGEPSFATLVPNVMLRNRQGRRFVDVTSAAGVGHLQKGHGIAFGDVDNDGDQDILLETGGFYPDDRAAAVLFENPGNRNRWITLVLHGAGANRFGVGATVRARVREGGQSRDVYALAGTGGSFGASSLQVEMGLGAAQRIEQLEIDWPDRAKRQRFSGVPLDRFMEVVEGRSELRELVRPRVRLGAGKEAAPAP